MKLCFMAALVVVSLSGTAHAEKERGGGNGIENKIIQSYIIDLESIPGYQDITRPALDRLKNIPVLHAQFTYELKSSTFYLLPSFASLRPFKSELPFTSDQITIHDLVSKEIFTRSDLFAGLESDFERGKHLLHEIVEGVVLTWDQYGVDCEKARNLCMKNVRLITNVLVDPSLPEATLQARLVQYGFRIETTMTHMQTRDRIAFALAEFKKAGDQYQKSADHILPLVRSSCQTGQFTPLFSALESEIRITKEKNLKSQLALEMLLLMRHHLVKDGHAVCKNLDGYIEFLKSAAYEILESGLNDLSLPYLVQKPDWNGFYVTRLLGFYYGRALIPLEHQIY